jgi:hypothetical protein
VEIFPTQ